MLSSKELKRLDAIYNIRSKNNDLWMGILTIALEADPVRTKNILREIKNNDLAVSGHLAEISDDYSEAEDRA